MRVMAWWEFKDRATRVWPERLVQRLAWLLPRRVAYWAAIRVAAHATTGPWSSQEVPSLTIEQMLKRWGTRHDARPA